MTPFYIIISMKDIFDYIKGQDKSFKEKGFTEADAVILSTMANLDMSDFYREGDKMKLSELIGDFLSVTPESEAVELRFLKALRDSPRYGNIEVSDVVHEISKKDESQFGAMVFHLPEAPYIAFAGTGTSVVGYKEDLNMAFMDIVPSQTQAVKYLNEVAEDLPGNLIVGGFSKGGNLAVFASAFSRDDIRERIKTVFDHDGPGFSELITNEEKFKEILPRVKSYVPKASIVGLMLNNEIKPKIIESTAPPIAQHQPYSWVFDGDELLEIEDLSKTSGIFKKLQQVLFDETSEKDRKSGINALFDILTGIEPDDFMELYKKGFGIAPAFRKTWKNAEDTTKKEVKSLFKTLTKTAFKSLRKKD